MKLWIIIALSTLILENKTDEFTITFKTDTDEFSVEVNSMKSTFWNLYIPDESDKNKLIPINYKIDKDGLFKTVLLGDIKMNEFINFSGVDWDKADKVKLQKEGATDINIIRDEDKKTLQFSQKDGGLIANKEEIIVTWK